MSEYPEGIQTEIAARLATIAKYLQNANTKLNSYLKEVRISLRSPHYLVLHAQIINLSISPNYQIIKS